MSLNPADNPMSCCNHLWYPNEIKDGIWIFPGAQWVDVGDDLSPVEGKDYFLQIVQNTDERREDFEIRFYNKWNELDSKGFEPVGPEKLSMDYSMGSGPASTSTPIRRVFRQVFAKR